MTTTLAHPDYDSVLDWQIEVENGEKPLRYLDVDDLTAAATAFRANGQDHLADTYGALATAVDEADDATAVEDLDPELFNAVFWLGANR